MQTVAMSRHKKGWSSMSHTKIALNPHLRRLRDEGFELEERSNHLLVHGMPYVTPGKAVSYGTLAMPLNMVGDEVGPPPDHTATFLGDCPCSADGKPLVIVTGSSTEDWGKGPVPIHQMSGKPPEPDKSYYDKVIRYEHSLGDQARAITAAHARWLHMKI